MKAFSFSKKQEQGDRLFVEVVFVSRDSLAVTQGLGARYIQVLGQLTATSLSVSSSLATSHGAGDYFTRCTQIAFRRHFLCDDDDAQERHTEENWKLPYRRVSTFAVPFILSSAA